MTYTHPIHPYPIATYNEEVSCFPNAIKLEISFGDFTKTEQDVDFVVLCKDWKCTENWGSYSGSDFPGKLSAAPLIIDASKFVIKFTSDGNPNDNWGYELMVTPIYTFGSY